MSTVEHEDENENHVPYVSSSTTKLEEDGEFTVGSMNTFTFKTKYTMSPDHNVEVTSQCAKTEHGTKAISID